MNDKRLLIKLAADVEGLKSGLKQARKQVDDFEGRVVSAGRSVAGAFGVTTGILAVGQSINFALRTLAGFEAEMSKVRAVTQSSQTEFLALRQNAIDLAKAHGFTTEEVARLQLEYARLGFSTKEILDSSKAAILLSKATGEDLALSAQIAGSTLRAFNLDASETNRVADVMAAAFNKSALGLADFGEAIKYVAPVAANAGLTIEQVSAMLGVLADNGIKGSMAGTSLRKIISDLGQGAAPVLTKRLAEMAAAGLSGAEAMDEVGRTAYASLLILSKNSEKVDQATDAYKNAKGELQAMADIMQDNLLGDWAKFNGQLDASIQKGSGVISVFRAIVQTMTGMVAVAGGDFAAPNRNWFLNALGIYPEDDSVEKARKQLEATAKLVEEVDGKIKKIQSSYTGAGNSATTNTAPASTTPSIRSQSLAALKDFKPTAAWQHEVEAYQMSLVRALAYSQGLAKSNIEIGTTSTQGFAMASANIQKMIDSGNLEALHAHWVQQQQDMQTAANMTADFSTIVGEAFGELVSGSASAAEAFGRASAQIVRSIGRMIMAQMIQKAIQDKATDFNFFAKLALIGIATATASSLLGKIGAGGGGGGGFGGGSAGGVGGGGTRLESLGQRIQIVGEVMVDGKQLKIALANQDRYDGRTKA